MKNFRKVVSQSTRGRKETSLHFPVVGVGASAGGLEAFTQLLQELPSDTGMAFVLIQHLDPSHDSLLAEALVKFTEMSVEEIRNGMSIEPNHVYVIPPSFDLDILKDTLLLVPREKKGSGRPHLPVNSFFRALAANCESRAIGVVLSGTANDGTDGLRAIKEGGGFTFAQDPDTAKFSGMPESAISAGVVDFSLAIPLLASELARISRHHYYSSRKLEPFSDPKDQIGFDRVLAHLKGAVGVDFSEYKSATTKRRLARRLALLRIESLKDYLKYLKENAGEARALHDDVLIHVTSFFRDPEAYKALQKDVFPKIMRHKQPRAAVRMWVAGCSSGEEVYSLVISFLEYLGEDFAQVPIQVFGSDISEKMIQKSRAGFYPESLLRDVNPDRLQRFFVKVEGGYQICKLVRDLCVFVRHDLARDPPLSRLDLITCRNVLIYFDSALQKRILSTFHYCLNQPGFLLLGRSENVASHQQLFAAEDKLNKIFSRANVPSQLRFPVPKEPSSQVRQKIRMKEAEEKPIDDISKKIDNLLLAEYAPCGVLINERLDAIQFRGRTSPFLEQPPGQPESNLLKMVREGLFVPIQMAVTKAKKEMGPVRKNGILVKQNGFSLLCNLVVKPVATDSLSKESLFLVLFEEVKKENTSKSASPKLSKANIKKNNSRSAKLEQELMATKEYLQSLNQEHQIANDSLAAANEELISGNEELQSMNEEMETAKEELQSTNEELTTVNDELQNRNSEIWQVNNDLVNLLDSVEIPIVILDNDRRIRRFTPHARTIMSLLPGDLGRSIDDIKLNISIKNLDEKIAEVIRSGTAKISEVRDSDDRWHQIQIRPYKTLDGKIDGVIISLADINVLKKAVSKAEWARDYATSIVEATQVPLIVLDRKIKVISANKAFYDIFVVTKADTEGKSLYDLGISEWNVPSLRASLGEMLEKSTEFQNAEIEREFPRVGKRTMSLSARSIHSDSEVPSMILLSMEDITDRKNREKERTELLRLAEEAKAEAEAANQTKDLFLATLSHELRTPLTSLVLQAQILTRGELDEAKVKRAAGKIEKAAKAQAQLIEDLLDISRILTGKLKMELKLVDLSKVVHDAVETVGSFAESKDVKIEVAIHEPIGRVSGDSIRLQQVFWNLLTNAVKFSLAGSKVYVSVRGIHDMAQVEIVDEGAGIDKEFLPEIFKRFSQAEGSLTRTHGGLGLGLAIVRSIVDLHGGSVKVQSLGKNRGSTFTVMLPMVGVVPISAGSGKSKIGSSQVLSKTSRASRLSGRRILVVEDDPGTREALSELLSMSGANVRTVASAAEGMHVLHEFRPDELICDISMPDEDGYSFIRKVRRLGPALGGDVPALALTALAGEKDRQQAFSAGFQMHLAKPVDFNRLTDALIELKEGNYTVH